MMQELSRDSKKEMLPYNMAFLDKSIAAPSYTNRYYINPINGLSFICAKNSGATIKFQLNCGQMGVYVDTKDSAFVFTLKNTSGQSLILDGSAHSVIQEISVFQGSTRISTTDNYNVYMSLLQDYMGVSDPLIGSSDLSMPLVYSATDIEDRLHYRKGVTIADNQSVKFCLPLINVIGSLSTKCIPTGQLHDSLYVEIKLTGSDLWGLYAATTTTGCQILDPRLWITEITIDSQTESALMAQLNGKIVLPTQEVMNYQSSIPQNCGSFHFQIPARFTSVNTIFVTFRQANKLNDVSYSLSRSKANLLDYSFKWGSKVIPSSAVDCSGDAVESRLELKRALNQISESFYPININKEWYNKTGTLGAADYGGFLIALNLSSFSSSDMLQDGLNSRGSQLSFTARFENTNPSLIVDYFVVHDQLLVVQNGLMSFES